ncbi:protein kinase [Striga asiatica]|uniref:Protein kinase n=1 Tax=Striga asiatica TaxID=4170 RepID=A0A5A7RLE7_STRAF|nr:protein kinase [Striga asiatica]
MSILIYRSIGLCPLQVPNLSPYAILHSSPKWIKNYSRIRVSISSFRGEMARQMTSSAFHKSKTLDNKYMLGDEIGKGAYGRVYKGLDLENGDFVAIKQVSLENIAQEDLNIIMQEIDLLKNLNHKNIVKYLGSLKTKSHLHIILEYVENGSLANIIKPNKFGPFPESLVALYISQVLEGLVYLHEQGVIHRDIKGANILTTKEGLVKLADFGVATKLTEADVNTHSVVGTPYWMAPEGMLVYFSCMLASILLGNKNFAVLCNMSRHEKYLIVHIRPVIEMSGVCAASDIWSVGCTVIELLTCVPPYYDLQPMPALFRIVQDEHPPIPDSLSPAITDFLRQCFKKVRRKLNLLPDSHHQTCNCLRCPILLIQIASLTPRVQSCSTLSTLAPFFFPDPDLPRVRLVPACFRATIGRIKGVERLGLELGKSQDARQRPDAKTLLSHPWIQNSRRALQTSLRHSGTLKYSTTDSISVFTLVIHLIKLVDLCYTIPILFFAALLPSQNNATSLNQNMEEVGSGDAASSSSGKGRTVETSSTEKSSTANRAGPVGWLKTCWCLTALFIVCGLWIPVPIRHVAKWAARMTGQICPFPQFYGQASAPFSQGDFIKSCYILEVYSWYQECRTELVSSETSETVESSEDGGFKANLIEGSKDDLEGDVISDQIPTFAIHEKSPLQPSSDGLEASLSDSTEHKPSRVPLQDEVLINGEMEPAEAAERDFVARKFDKNGSSITIQHGKTHFNQKSHDFSTQKDVEASMGSGTNELSRFSDPPGDASLDDLFHPLENLEDHGAEASTSASTSHAIHGNSVSDNGKNDLATKLRATIAQKQMENESAQTNGGDLLRLMMGVIKKDVIDIDTLGFEDKLPAENLFHLQAVEFGKLVSSLRPDEPEDVIVSSCQKLTTFFHQRPEQKIVFITQHGLLPLLELLEVPRPRIICSVLQVLNQIIKDNTDFQENACLVGLIPVVMSFAVHDRPREVRMEAAYFVQQLCQSSSSTLQMFIACRGIPILVGFMEPDYAKYREMVHMAIDGMWQVFKLQKSTSRDDFFRIAAKNGILLRLINTLYSLNEATRLASIASGSGFPPDGSAPRPRSDPLDFSSPFVQMDSSLYGNDQPDQLKVRQGDQEASRASVSHSPESRFLFPNVEASSASRVMDPASLERISNMAVKDYASAVPRDRENADRWKNESSRAEVELKQQKVVNATNRPSTDRAPKSVDMTTNGSSAYTGSQQENVRPLLSLLDKEPPSSHFSGQLEYVRHLTGVEKHETILPLLHASNDRKTNGLDFLMAQFAEVTGRGREASNVDSLPKSSPKAANKKMVNLASNGGIVAASGLASQRASGVLSGSGVLNARPGSATSSGLLSNMVSPWNVDVAREYLEKVADLLLEFAAADTAVKSYMCSQSLLSRLFQMFNKIEPPILLKVQQKLLKCINHLSTDPHCLEHLQRADALKYLIPNLDLKDGSLVSQIHHERNWNFFIVYYWGSGALYLSSSNLTSHETLPHLFPLLKVLNALFNLCKINKRRQEQAAENGIIPHLMHFIMSDSPLKQYALPLLCDMAHASRNSREQLRAHGGLDVYLSLLEDELWSVTALDSIAVCLAHDNENRKVEQALLKKDAVQKLVKFFQFCPEQHFLHILEPFLKIITKSSRINTTLAVNGLTPLLISRLDHPDAIARLNLLKLIKVVYEHHPRPKQLIVENDLPQKLQNLIEERREGQSSGGQVLVKQMATSLLKALHINTVL